MVADPLAPGVFAKALNPDVFSVSAGLRNKDRTVRLARDAGAFAVAVGQMNVSDAGFHLLDSFNNWNDGTELESATPRAARFAHHSATLPVQGGGPPGCAMSWAVKARPCRPGRASTRLVK